MKEWLRKVRCGKLADLLSVLRRKLHGYWNYYGVIGNSSMTAKYQREVHRLLYKWLNRRSQRRSIDLDAVRPPPARLGPSTAPGGGAVADSRIASESWACMMKSNKPTKDLRRTGCASTEEPGAVVPHAGICEVAPGNRRPYLNR